MLVMVHLALSTCYRSHSFKTTEKFRHIVSEVWAANPWGCLQLNYDSIIEIIIWTGWLDVPSI